MAFEVVKKLFRTVRNLITGEQMKVNPEVAEIENLSTDRMQEAITEWLNMYLGSAPWIDEEGQSLGIPTVMAAEIARSVTLEMEMNINGDSPMAEFIAAQMKPFLSNIRSKVEYACATGGVIFKPYICDDGITIETVLPIICARQESMNVHMSGMTALLLMPTPKECAICRRLLRAC